MRVVPNTFLFFYFPRIVISSWLNAIYIDHDKCNNIDEKHSKADDNCKRIIYCFH